MGWGWKCAKPRTHSAILPVWGTFVHPSDNKREHWQFGIDDQLLIFPATKGMWLSTTALATLSSFKLWTVQSLEPLHRANQLLLLPTTAVPQAAAAAAATSSRRTAVAARVVRRPGPYSRSCKAKQKTRQ